MAKPEKIMIGWREWVALPEFAIPHLKAKVDSGARTSALHAYYIKPYKRKGELRIKFGLHPYQNSTRIAADCDARVVDYRTVMDSGGHREKRYVISTPLEIGGQVWQIEVTLTNRETMKFRMLLGRTAMDKRVIVDPGRSYLLGKLPKSARKL
ncbi:MAG TPA: ATP-dependent zinc protease [Gammaproteobacteria bacterium]